MTKAADDNDGLSRSYIIRNSLESIEKLPRWISKSKLNQITVWSDIDTSEIKRIPPVYQGIIPKAYLTNIIN